MVTPVFELLKFPLPIADYDYWDLETARNNVFEPTVQRRGSERSCGFRFALAVWVITNLS
jgi:hypothetical protein